MLGDLEAIMQFVKELERKAHSMCLDVEQLSEETEMSSDLREDKERIAQYRSDIQRMTRELHRTHVKIKSLLIV